MTKRKRAWVEPNPKHPRSSKNGRFVKRGTGASSAAKGAEGPAGPSGTKEPVKLTGPATLPRKGISLARREPKVIKPLEKGPARFRGGTMGAALESGAVTQKDRAEVEKFLREATNFTTSSGMTVSVRSAQMNRGLRAGSPHWIDVTYDIRDANGKTVGEAIRKWSPPSTDDYGDHVPTHVNHTSMHLDKSAQGNGFATEWNRHMEQVYKANGIKEIRLTANEDVGGYAWAKQGYDWANEDAPTDAADRIRDQIADRDFDDVWTRAGIAELRKLEKRLRSGNRAKMPTPLEISLVGWTPGAKMWAGKAVLLDSSWEGKKKL